MNTTESLKRKKYANTKLIENILLPSKNNRICKMYGNHKRRNNDILNNEEYTVTQMARGVNHWEVLLIITIANSLS